MTARDHTDPLSALYAADIGVRGQRHLEAAIRLAAGYQFREEGIVEHLRRIAEYVRILAGRLDWPTDEAAVLHHAALFHDVGMVDVPEEILRKRGKLDQNETALMRRHPELGRVLLGSGDGPPLLREAASLAWTHHECFDGTGYPRGLAGDDIPVGARILAVADVLDALTTRRSFKDAYPFDVAVEMIRASAGRHFDPRVVEAFCDCAGDIERVCRTMATGEVPSSPGFRVSARDRSEEGVYAVARSAYFSCPYCKRLHPRATERCAAFSVRLRDIHKLSGRLLDEKYQIGEALGVGGMGAVYEARHVLIGRRFAVKFLDSELAHDEANLTRFYNEARVSATVGHSSLVEVTDMGRTPEGIPFIVMEMLDGRSLAQIRKERGVLAPIAATTITMEILDALAAVHKKGIVHRDLKPENIYLVGDASERRIKILDFGVSLLAAPGLTRRRLTITGDVFGTPQYMSPEQAQGKLEVDRRSDLFTVGEILYELVTGRPVFEGDNQLAVIRAVVWCEVISPAALGVDLDPVLEAAIMRALQRDPGDRFQSAAEFAEMLREYAARDPRWAEHRIVGFDDEPSSKGPAVLTGARNGHSTLKFTEDP